MKKLKLQIKTIMKKLDFAISQCNEEKQKLLIKELDEKMKEFFAFLSKSAKVKIEVKGGIAEITECPEWIKVRIEDHDDF